MEQLKRWAPALIIMAAIYVLSSIPGSTLDQAGLGNENLHVSGHFLTFFILYFAVYKATKSYLKSLLIIAVYALTDELHQSYVPLRTASMKDIVTDVGAGIAAGGLLWSFYQKLPKILKNWLES